MNNEVWFAGTNVLRISTSQTTARLAWEAQVAQVLPPTVPHAPVVSHGATEYGEWLIGRRIPGWPLSRGWGEMNGVQRRSATHQLADAMRGLHGCPGPMDDHGPVVPPFLRDPASLECPHQLPASRLLALIERCAQLKGVDPGLFRAAADVVHHCAAAFAGEPPRGLVHGDLHLENVLWDGSRLTAILDFEWARLAPPDLDLDVLLRFCADPELHVTADYKEKVRRHDYANVPNWLREGYPALFGHPRLRDRLTLYALAYDVRHLLTDPPRQTLDSLPGHHAYHRIRRVVEGRTHLSWMDL
jgi:aminoglycoside phosphotransferase (APT) family kinase protein